MENHRKKLEKAEDELTQAISESLAELMPQMQRTYHISQRACTLAVSSCDQHRCVDCDGGDWW